MIDLLVKLQIPGILLTALFACLIPYLHEKRKKKNDEKLLIKSIRGDFELFKKDSESLIDLIALDDHIQNSKKVFHNIARIRHHILANSYKLKTVSFYNLFEDHKTLASKIYSLYIDVEYMINNVDKNFQAQLLALTNGHDVYSDNPLRSDMSYFLKKLEEQKENSGEINKKIEALTIQKCKRKNTIKNDTLKL